MRNSNLPDAYRPDQLMVMTRAYGLALPCVRDAPGADVAKAIIETYNQSPRSDADRIAKLAVMRLSLHRTLDAHLAGETPV